MGWVIERDGRYYLRIYDGYGIEMEYDAALAFVQKARASVGFADADPPSG